MVRLNIDALKIQDTSPSTDSGEISATEASILSVNQTEVASTTPVVSEENTETPSTPSTLDLIESDEVKF